MNPLLKFARLKYVKSTIVRGVIPVLDVLLAPVTFVAAFLMKSLRRVGVYRMPVTRAILNAIGVFPIRDHYYEPLFHPRHIRAPLDTERSLPGIDLNEAGQLGLLARFDYAAELGTLSFDFGNPNFAAGDAEFLYCAIRHFKPARILEIGSGFSTLMMLEAIRVNQTHEADYRCRLTCVEPYEMEWLEKRSGIEVLRQTAEALDERRVSQLEANDILFIDSSHVIRPQGDVVREYLGLLPLLARGVLVHLHDIFTPRDYPRRWVVDEVRLYNEQYLFEAFMCSNRDFRIIGALNLLAHRHPEALATKFPAFRASPDCEPRSMWLMKA